MDATTVFDDIAAAAATAARLIAQGVPEPEIVGIIAAALRSERRRHAWKDIATAPRDETRFWGRVGEDAIAMVWHPGFAAFVSSWRRMDMAAGYTIDGQRYKDHSPVVHRPTHWMDMAELPEA
jgi:hypothetical protein